MPASRRAAATTFAPRSWPSRPGLATRTRVGRARVWVFMVGRSYPLRERATSARDTDCVRDRGSGIGDQGSGASGKPLTLAPGPWPLEEYRLAVRPVHAFQRMADFIERAVGTSRIQHRGNHVRVPLPRLAQSIECPLHAVGIP